MKWFILFIALMLLGNSLVTLRLIKSRETFGRKFLFGVAIWLIPFLGALLVFLGTSPPGVQPYPIQDSNIPGDLT